MLDNAPDQAAVQATYERNLRTQAASDPFLPALLALRARRDQLTVLIELLEVEKQMKKIDALTAI